jgi:hypothetical protein
MDFPSLGRDSFTFILNILMTSSEVELYYDFIPTFLVHIFLHSYRSSVQIGESKMSSMPRANIFSLISIKRV